MGRMASVLGLQIAGRVCGGWSIPEWGGCGDGCHSLCREAAEGGGPHVAGGQKAERGKGAHSRAGSIFRDVMDEGRRHSCTAHWRNLEKRQATSARSILMSTCSGLQVKCCALFSPLCSSQRSLRLYCPSLGRACTHNGSAPPPNRLASQGNRSQQCLTPTILFWFLAHQ